MKNNDVFEWLGNGLAVVLTSLQTNEIYQIISFVLTSLSVIVTILFTIWKWYKKANEDGKITRDEIQELQDDLHKEITKGKEKEKDE